MHSRGVFAAAGFDVTAAIMSAAATYPKVAEVAAGGLRPASAVAIVGPGSSPFIATLRALDKIATPPKRRQPEWILLDSMPGLDGEARWAAFRALAEDIAESTMRWATLTSGFFERLRDVIHELLDALVGLRAAVHGRTGVQAPQLVSVSRHRLSSLSIAPGAPPVSARLHPHEGLVAAA